MPTIQALQSFFQQASARGSKSTVLQPMVWLVGILLSGLIGGAAWEAPSWMLVTLSVFLGISLVLFMAGFAYFGITNPDLLRSETFQLQKIAMENNLIGDNQAGMKEVPEGTVAGTLESPPQRLEDKR